MFLISKLIETVHWIVVYCQQTACVWIEEEQISPAKAGDGVIPEGGLSGPFVRDSGFGQ
jgi:hypothetical protein